MVDDWRVTVGQNLRDKCRSSIPDPIQRGDQWIWDDYPFTGDLEEDSKIDFPRISITRMDSAPDANPYVGDPTSRREVEAHIDIWVESGVPAKDTANYGSNTQSGKLRDKLTDRAFNLFKEHKKAITSDFGWLDYTLAIQGGFGYDPQFKLFHERVVIVVQLES